MSNEKQREVNINNIYRQSTPTMPCLHLYSLMSVNTNFRSFPWYHQITEFSSPRHICNKSSYEYQNHLSKSSPMFWSWEMEIGNAGEQGSCETEWANHPSSG